MEQPREIQARRGLSISYKGKVLLSKIDPIVQAEKLIQSLELKENTLYLCPSPIFAYGLENLLDRMHKSSAILCIEADKHLFEIALKAVNNIPGTKQRLLLTMVKSPATHASTDAAQEICSLVDKTWGERRFRRIELIRLNGGWQLFPKLYEDIKDLLQKDLALKWTNAMVMIRLGRLFIRNVVRNLPLLPKSREVSSLNFNDEPILVLGAGPSADTILDEISVYKKANERPFRIICVDSCLPMLKERGIEPDLAVVLESQHVNLRAFLNTKGWGVNVLCDLSSLPASINSLGGDYFFGFTPWTELSVFKRLKKTGLLPEPLTPLGSVGLTAVELALRLGSGKIITAGLDFSYSIDSSYSRSSPVHLSRLINTSRFISILSADTAYREGTFNTKSKSGLPVRTDPAMINYRNLFEHEFSKNPRIFDINGSGLNLGTQTIAPSKALDILCNTGSVTQGSVKEAKPWVLCSQIKEFVLSEVDMLNEIKNMLKGDIPLDEIQLNKLLYEADYLWQHFPDYTGTSEQQVTGQPDDQKSLSKNLSFLKRVRMEIDPFLTLWNMALEESRL